MKLGFIGQGWIGKHLADHFEERGFTCVRYDVTPKYKKNKNAIKECEITFIAVPTPTTTKGFDDSILRGVFSLIGKGKTAVIKSTVLPGTTDAIQKDNPDIMVLHVPEFLREVSVKHDIDYPDRNIVGIPDNFYDDAEFQKAAARVMKILPHASYESICKASEAELTKYGGNNFLYAKVVYMNVLFDLANTVNARFDVVAANLRADPRVGFSHMQPIHQYEHMDTEKGRGAGGHCFIKDFAAMREVYERLMPDDKEGIALLKAFEAKNNKLLRKSRKDLDLLDGVYGKSAGK
jgi:UDPglucose 6-dehydrogenase